MRLTVHGLQSDQTGDEVVKVDSHVGLRVAQDDQLEQCVGQLETWRRGDKQEDQTQGGTKGFTKQQSNVSERRLTHNPAGNTL